MKARSLVRWTAACLAACAAPPAQAQTAEGSFSVLQEKLGLAAAAKPAHEQLLARISQDAFALQIVLPRIRPTDEPEFARSISYNAALLDRARYAPDTEATAILADVADDLEVKRLAASGMGASSTFPGRIRVRVHTIRNGQPVAGYRITLNPVRWRSQEPMYRLPNLSPASGEVPPGRYEVAAIQANVVKAREIFRIGLAAEDEVTIELPVP